MAKCLIGNSLLLIPVLTIAETLPVIAQLTCQIGKKSKLKTAKLKPNNKH